jgi:hypothetical protein
MPPKGGNAKKEGGRAKKAENEVSFGLPCLLVIRYHTNQC